MFPNNNNESKIEILKNRIDETIIEKDKAVKELDKDISCLEKELKNLDADINAFNNHLRTLRHKRESIEIECFKTIMKYHKQILKYQHNGR